MRKRWNTRLADLTMKDYTKISLELTVISMVVFGGLAWVVGTVMERKLENEMLDIAPDEE